MPTADHKSSLCEGGLPRVPSIPSSSLVIYVSEATLRPDILQAPDLAIPEYFFVHGREWPSVASQVVYSKWLFPCVRGWVPSFALARPGVSEGVHSQSSQTSDQDS